MFKRLIISVLACIVLAVAGIYFVYAQEKAFLNAPVLNTETLLYELPAGRSLSHVLLSLEQEKIIASSEWQRKVLARTLRYIEPQLATPKAGTYRLETGATLRELLALFAQGREHQFSIRLAEGKTFKQWMLSLKTAPHLEHKLESLCEEQIAKQLGSQYTQLEGLLLPETYHYTKGSSDLSLLRRAYKDMQAVIEMEWQKRRPSKYIKSPYEALILASIIEKETAVSDERDKVASVFINRLKRGMRLQTDPTVIYGMGDDYNGNITRKDLKTPTDYNTYVIYGLPPTPIAMPSRESIHAALHPATTKYLYFVANGKGGHKFSHTLQEHNRAVKEYLRIIRNK